MYVMKTIVLLLTIICSVSLIKAEPVKVLFIGNSITYFNDLPQTFESIANSLGDETEVTVYAPGGTGFIDHAYDPNVFNHFRQGGWDFIVLQPGSNESPGYSYTIEETLGRAKILTDSIYMYNPCANVLFYEISYGVWGSTPENIDTYNATMDLIRENLTYLADSTKTFFAPVGEAFRTAWNNDPDNLLWGSTGDIHPNAEGSYIAACVFYASIFQKPSLGTPIINTLSESKAAEYQLLADATVLNHLQDWRINTYKQSTDFDFELNSSLVTFTNLSENVDSVYWDFNDGSNSTEFEPAHNYTETGSFVVNLTTYFHSCSQTVSNEINISVLDVLALNNQEPNIYPNPTNGILCVEVEDFEKTSIYNITGKLVLESNEKTIDISQLPKGVYLIKVFANGIVSNKKIVKK